MSDAVTEEMIRQLDAAESERDKYLEALQQIDKMDFGESHSRCRCGKLAGNVLRPTDRHGERAKR